MLVSDEPEYSTEDLREVVIKNGLIFAHATSSFHYTTYDARRDRDSINVNGKRRDAMVRANNDPDPSGSRQHPFWYARVLAIYHVNVYCGHNTRLERVEFLFVRWFGMDPEWIGGPTTRRLDRVGFVPADDASGAFGFLNPDHILRAFHLIPSFAHGRTTHLPPSRCRDLPLKETGLITMSLGILILHPGLLLISH